MRPSVKLVLSCIWCNIISPSLSLSDHTYEFLVEEQPIGCKLFHMYCQKDMELSKCVNLINALDEFLLVADEKRVASAHKIFGEFISLEVCIQYRNMYVFSVGTLLTVC